MTERDAILASSPPSAETVHLSAPGPHQSVVQCLPKEIRNLLAGGVAGMVAKSVVAPIDRIKILYQVTSAHFRIRDVPRVAAEIVRTEGVAALWKGNVATMLRVFPYSGIQFMVFDRIKRHFLLERQREDMSERETEASQWLRDGNRSLDTDPAAAAAAAAAAAEAAAEAAEDDDARSSVHNSGLTPLESMLGGSTAGVISVSCTYPLDLTRAQLAVLKKTTGANARPQGFVSVLTKNYESGGARGLYRGINPTLLGILPYSGVAFTINEQAKRKITSFTGRDPTTLERMQCGALAGLVAQAMTYPLEVTRRRMQTVGVVHAPSAECAVGVLGGTVAPASQAHPAMQALDHAASRRSAAVASSVAEPDMIATISGVFREQGLRGLFKGVSVNFFKGPVAFSISFTTFDMVQGFLEGETW